MCVPETQIATRYKNAISDHRVVGDCVVDGVDEEDAIIVVRGGVVGDCVVAGVVEADAIFIVR